MVVNLDPSKTLDDFLHLVLNTALVKVKASAGSLMMVDSSGKELHIKARLGPPRERRTSEPVFEIQGEGIASYVARERRARIVKNVATEDLFKRTQHGKLHFKSLLCVPILYKGRVYGVINADHEREDRFNARHRNAVTRLCKDVAPIIAERISVPEALSRITARLSRETAGGDIEKTLSDIAHNIKSALGADVVLLYQYEQSRDEFVRTRNGGPTVAGKLEHPEFMKTAVYRTDVPYQILKSGEPVFIPDTSAQTDEALHLRHRITRHGQKHPKRERFCIREGILSLVALPLIHSHANASKDKEFVGVLFVNYGREHNFNIDEKAALKSFGDTAAFAILNARREVRNRMEKTGLYHRVDCRAHGLLNGDSKSGKAIRSRFYGTEADCFVMAVDIRRSTDLMLHATSPNEFETFISEAEGTLKQAVKENWGIVDKFTGDGLLAHFPIFFSGEDAGLHCLKSAAECHERFADLYERSRSSFQIVLRDVGLGIGVDYGRVHFRMAGQELIAVGRPVVYACRLSSVDKDRTVLNEQAVDELLKSHADKVITNDLTMPVKHQGDCIVTQASLLPGVSGVQPPWLSELEQDGSKSRTTS